ATVVYPLSLHDALPIFGLRLGRSRVLGRRRFRRVGVAHAAPRIGGDLGVRYLLQRFLVGLIPRLFGVLLLLRLAGTVGEQIDGRSEEHTSELQSPCNLV